MLTLYSPVKGIVEALPAGDGLAVVAASGPQRVAAPTRGTVTESDAAGVTITDLQDRVVEVRIEADPGTLTPLVATGDPLKFDQPLFAWNGSGTLRVLVVSPGATDALPHAEPGSEVAAGADLFSVGPFSCGA
nr:hypothetical protein [Propionibacterium sp.]